MTDTTDHRHWQRINELLEVALGLPREDRDGWLKSLPAEDAALGPKLREMLARSGIEVLFSPEAGRRFVDPDVSPIPEHR